MKRVTLRVPARQLAKIEKQVVRGEFPNRSEAIRAAIRSQVSGVTLGPGWEELLDEDS